MYKPNPVPASDFVANFSNSLGSISLSIPVPVSFTIIFTCLFSLSIFFFILTIICPFLVNLYAIL